MSSKVREPNITEVLAKSKASVIDAKTQANDNVKAHIKAYEEELDSIKSNADRDLILAGDTQKIATAISKTKLEAEGKKLEAAEEVVRKALEALEKAEENFSLVYETHTETVKTLKSEFNKAGKDIKERINSETKASKLAYKAAKLAEKAKVSAVRSEARQNTVSEVRAAVDYRLYVTKDGIVSTGNGVAQVFTSLTESFGKGYKADSGVKIPESLKPSQKTVVKKTAKIKNS